MPSDAHPGYDPLTTTRLLDRRWYRSSHKRRVTGLEEAVWAEAAHGGRTPKLTPSQRRGLRHERRVVKRLRQLYGGAVTAGPWIEYVDAGGWGLAQPDAVVQTPRWCAVVECKLRYGPGVEDELRDLYGPLVAWIEGREPLLVAACHDVGWLPVGAVPAYLGDLPRLRPDTLHVVAFS